MLNYFISLKSSNSWERISQPT